MAKYKLAKLFFVCLFSDFSAVLMCREIHNAFLSAEISKYRVSENNTFIVQVSWLVLFTL